ncbi:hypothetical protein H310_12817 [Aphanomyces invadans]|uniref:RING-type domain-containing protein n=1 Tax=Aphanomyces invadans TaxID=157072 RepID=A0A024TI01_9STRA|nr:hypothetical protein H310_12817 [Aphanomyces invadans]ETV93221.1 hypothetical protein H310_12817 [Aphanomyces invadans]|eukprot:XP_008878243.1 hypothetical protein H310_12817 [Aphanomyces invadans]
MVANSEGATATNNVVEGDTTGTIQENRSASMPQYWCHLCACNVLTRLNSESDEVECDRCGGCFVEEIEDDTPGQERPQDFVPHEGSARQDSESRRQGSSEEGTRAIRVTRSSLPNMMNEIFQLSRQGISSNSDSASDEGRSRFTRTRLFTSNGGPVEVFINGVEGSGAAGFMGALGGMFRPSGSEGVGTTLGDYAFGNISTIINHLMQNDSSQHGAPPAAKTVLESLPKVHISQGEVDDKHDCAVCKDVYELKEEAIRLPCSHDFHTDCIMPWLKQHNSCPVCRYELPTDDQEYETARAAASANTPANSTMAS